jgi:hypothetical protein
LEDRLSGEGVPTYSAGDTISVCVVVRPWPAGKGICRIRATFAHEADPTKEIELSDDPASRSHAQVQTEDDVELRGLVVAGDHPVGEYRLKEMAAEYPGGRVVRFAGTPEASFRVVEEEIKSPEVVGWRWL